MDPDATRQEMRDAYDAGDWARVEELADALIRWIDSGGFPPAGWGHRGMARQNAAWYRKLARRGLIVG